MMSCDVSTLEQGYNIYQQLNLYVLQVRNLCSCVKVAEDFVSPEVSSTNDLNCNVATNLYDVQDLYS